MPWDQVPQLAERAAPLVQEQVYQAAVAHDLMDTVVAGLVQEALARVDFPRPAVGGDLLGDAIGMLGRALQTPLGDVALDQVEEWLVQSPAAGALRDAALDGVKRYLDDHGARLAEIVVRAAAVRLSGQG
jgi:hypothetical protein